MKEIRKYLKKLDKRSQMLETWEKHGIIQKEKRGMSHEELKKNMTKELKNLGIRHGASGHGTLKTAKKPADQIFNGQER